MKKYQLSIHLFRRDLRLHDNSALIAALEQSKKVLPVFIFDERQLENPYRGNNSFQFLINSLLELDQKLRNKGSRLYFFKGIAHEVIQQIIELKNPDAIFFNRDYTPFSRKRDEAIAETGRRNHIETKVFADTLLNEPEQVLKDDGKPYSVFTPFLKKARFNTILHPMQNSYANYFSENLTISSSFKNIKSLIKKYNPNLMLTGGRAEGIELLGHIEKMDNYEEQRNIPAVCGTSLLSAHHKFGTVSIRETYHKIVSFFGEKHTLINELYWRDFFTHVVWHFPHVIGNAFREKYNQLPWSHNEQNFERWCKGQTGFPIVDAGMRELVQTGYMHNRVRMIVASFLTKDLHIDWSWGERFFANHLIDYDPAVNNGNWQWSASTGCDAQPYFRIFNPWNQQRRFDPECSYIKKWIPELKSFNPKQIHNLEKGDPLCTEYPMPMLKHKEEVLQAKAMFKA